MSREATQCEMFFMDFQCEKKAKRKVVMPNGTEWLLCGVCANRNKMRAVSIEPMKKLKD